MANRRIRICDVTHGVPVELPCGCRGKRWGQRDRLIWVSVARACAVHDIAMHEGLWVAPTMVIRCPDDDSPLQLGLHIFRDALRPRIIVQAAPDGTTLAFCQGLTRQRSSDGTWRMATLVESDAMPPSPTDAWLLAEFTASIVQKQGPRGPIAVVAADAAQFEIAQAYERYSPLPAPHSFRSRNEAAAWLDSQGF